MKVEVSNEDIQNGKKFNREKCPISLAIKRTNLRDKDVFVYSNCVYIFDGREYYDNGQKRTDHKIKLPDEAIQFNYDFDNGKEVKEFSFILEYEP